MENAFYILRGNLPSTISQVQDSITSLKALSIYQPADTTKIFTYFISRLSNSLLF